MRKGTRNSRVRMALEECIPTGQEITVSQIKELLAEKGMIYEEDYSEGNLAGNLRVLTLAGMLRNVKRGVYFREFGMESQEQSDVQGVLEEDTGIISERNKKTESEDERIIKNKRRKREIEDVLKECENKKRIIKESTDDLEKIIKDAVFDSDMSASEFEELKAFIDFRRTIVAGLEKFEG